MTEKQPRILAPGEVHELLTRAIADAVKTRASDAYVNPRDAVWSLVLIAAMWARQARMDSDAFVERCKHAFDAQKGGLLP